MRVRATLDFYAKSSSDAAKVLDALLAATPEGEQFSWSIKGQDWFEPRAERNGKRVAREKRVSRVRDTAY